MAEEVHEVHKKARKGIKLLIARQAVLQILTLAGGIFLARKLSPSVFGLYSIATFLVTTFALFSDFGLAPSLIQRKNELKERDIQVAFTMQQAITTVIVLLLFSLAPWLVHFYPKVPHETVWLLRALAFSLYLTSWRTMSALQLERKLRYDRLAWIEVAENLLYQTVAVVMAVLGKGVWSFVWAILVRGVFGATAIYLASPWKVKFGFDRVIARDILRFGIPFQLGNIVQNMGGWVTPILVGGMIGPGAVGYLSWASSNGKKPLTLVDSVMRVAFPHFSRIQDDRAEVERLMARYLTYLLIPAGIWFALLVVTGPTLVHWIYTPKWVPAVPAICLYALAMSFDVIVWVVSVSMNACGLPKLAVKRALVRTIGQVALSVPLVLKFGFNGVPIAYLATIVLTLPWTFMGLGAGTMGRVLRPVAWLVLPVLCGVAAGMASLRLHLHAPAQTVLSAVVVIAAYAIGAYVTCPAWLRAMVGSRLLRLSRLKLAAARA